MMNETAQVQSKKLPSRDYKCPCGKTYLSYAALFTHIKQKHEGKAPGQIEKPKLESKPRGRPPLIAKTKEVFADKGLESSKDTFTTIEDREKNKNYYNDFYNIFTILSQIEEPQEIGLQIWEQVSSFRKFEEFIDFNQEIKKGEETKISLGIGLSEFLKHISLQTDSWKFEQVLILFMLLVQYVIDENNYEGIIEEGHVDILVEYMNPFLNHHIDDYGEYLGIQHLWVLHKTNMHQIFSCFYYWLKWKEYTTFCITLID